MLLRTTLVASLLLRCLLAQEEPPSARELAAAAHELAARAAEASQIEHPDAEQKQARAAMQKVVDEFVGHLETWQGLSVEHYIEASSPLLVDLSSAAVKIAEAGLQHYPDNRFLWDHVGFARTQIASDLPPCADRVKELHEAERAFRKALSNVPDTFHAHLGIQQVLSLLDRCDEALAELDIGLADEQGKAAIPAPWLLRAGLLLRLNRAAEAVSLLTSDAVPDESRDDADILLLRAHAIGGNSSAAHALIKKMRTADPGARTLVEAADALAYLGKKSDAQQLLAQRPKRGDFADEDERIEQLLVQSAAAMEVFWKANDWSTKGPLRAALTKALEHKFLVMDGTAKPKPKETDLTSSPVLIAQMLGGGEESDEKGWGNRTVLVLAIRAMPGYKPSPLEAQMASAMKDKRTPTAADVPAIFLAMRWDVGNPDASGVLTGLRAIEKLEAAVPAKK